jgi:hypothetical protein
MPKKMYELQFPGVPEDSIFSPVVRVTTSQLARVQLVRMGVTFDGFTKEQLELVAQCLKADSKVQDLVRSVERNYRDHAVEVADLMEEAARDL